MRLFSLILVSLLLASCRHDNTPPGAPVVSIGPTEPGTDDDLVVVIDQPAEDEDEDTVTYAYAWKQNGLPRTDLTGDTVPASQTAKGETWEVKVTANDGEADGEPASAGTTIVDTPPVVTVTIEPWEPTTADDLEAVATATDADGDAVSLVYAWTVDGAPTEHAGDGVPASETAKHDVWEVTVTPYDGEIEGEAASAAVEIANTPPVAAVTFEPLLPAADEDVVAVASATDADGDVVTFAYAWSVDGKATANTTDTVTAKDTAAGQRWEVTVTPSDDEEAGEQVTAAVPIENTAPVMVSVTLQPDAPYVTQDVTALVEASDIDGDAVTYTYTWSVDGAEVLSGASDTLPAGSFAKHQTIAVEVVPNDGFADGAPLLSAESVVRNSLPTATGASITPATAYEATTLTCAPAGFVDADGDPEGWLYEWTVDGTPAGTASTLTGSVFDKGNTVVCSTTPWDGEESGKAVTSASLTISNTPPTLASVVLSEYAPTESDTLSVILGASADADGDTVTFLYDWYVDSSVVSTSSTLPPSRFAKGNSIYVVVTPYDGESYGSPVTSVTATAENTPPEMISVALDPGDPFVTDDVVATADSYDADDDTVTYTYTWSVDDFVVLTGTSDTLPAGAFEKHESITVEVVPNDGDEDGESLVSSDAVVQNSLPTATGASITPATAYEATTLTCVPAGFVDADGDAEGWTYRWTVEGTTAGTGSTLTGSAFDKGDVVICRATPWDGEDSGTAVTSSSITISNTAPVIASVTLSPSAVYTDGTLTASVSASDADADTVTYTYAWYVDGSPRGSVTSATLSGVSYFDRDQEVYVVVTPSDGEEDGVTSTSTTITVSNSPPSAPVVEITPEDAVEGDDLTCTVTTESTDADGDALTYAFEWDVDGEMYDGADDDVLDSVVDGTDVGAEETWTCEVIANDGTDESGVASDSVVISGCYLLSEGTSTYAYCAETWTWASWSDGEEDCISRGGHLVTVSDAAEYAFLTDWIESARVSSAGPWIGLNDHAIERTWVWVSGESGYTYWAPGEPNSGGGVGPDEDCVIMGTSYTGMRDVPCAEVTPYICEW